MIQIRIRFIEHEESRMAEQRTRESDALLLSAQSA